MSKIRLFINSVIELFTEICFVLMFITVVFQVFARSLSSWAVPWTDEFARFLYVWVVFIGAIVTTNNNEHVRVEVVFGALPPTIRRYFGIAQNLVSMGFCLAAAYGGIILVELNAGFYFPSLPRVFTYSMMYITIPLSMIAIFLLLLAKTIMDVYTIASGKPAAPLEDAAASQ